MNTEKPELQRIETGRLEISTLGLFQARCGDQLLSDNASRSNRLWELLKYLITHRDKGNAPDVIVETLWPDQEYDDPRGALRTLVYRLRQLLGKGACVNGTEAIVFSQGCYHWNTKQNYWLDVDEFELLCRQAQAVAATDPQQATLLYLKAIGLYKGDYLPECSYCEWVIPIRNYYHHLYLQSILALTTLLSAAEQYAEVIEVCEHAFIVDPFEEELHVRFLEALLAEDKLKQARAHYEYATTMFYRELGVKPSAVMRRLYQRMRAADAGVELDLTVIQDHLREKGTAGAFLCDPDTFRFLYKLEKRRAERTGQSIFLGLLTFTRPDYGLPAPAVLKPAAEQLRGLLQLSLRKGDVVCHWNEAQHLVIMPGLSQEQAEIVLGRIEQRFSGSGKEQVVLRLKIQSLV